jgi:uncharacterized membrane protein YhaH (DUF805 family)
VDGEPRRAEPPDWRSGPGTPAAPDPFFQEFAAAEPAVAGVHRPAQGPVPELAEDLAIGALPTQAGRKTYEVADPNVVLRSMSGVAPALNQPWYGIGFRDAVKRAWQKQTEFSGRASRGEFWWFALADAMVKWPLVIVAYLLGPGWVFLDPKLSPSDGAPLFGGSPAASASIVTLLTLWLLCELATVFPRLALVWRRLHDAGRSGLWFFTVLVPLAGLLYLTLVLRRPTALAGALYDQRALGSATVLD